MTNFKIADTGDEEPATEVADADAKPTDESETPDEEAVDAPDDSEPKVSDDRDASDEGPAHGTASEHCETVELQWRSEKEGAEMPLADAVEANAGRLADTVSDSELKSVRHTIETLRYELDTLHEEIDELREENDALRERANALERWKKKADTGLDRHSNDIRQLLAASDLATTGTCPKCNDAPLEKKRPLVGRHRVECTNENCGYVAELEGRQ